VQKDGTAVGNKTVHYLFAGDQAVIAQDKYDAECMTKKLIEEGQKLGFNADVLETECLSVGSDIQNIKLEYNIEFKDSRSFRYVGSNVMNSVKFNKELLSRIEQARTATRALNSLLCSKYFAVNTKKQIFFAVIESILRYGWEILKLNYQLKKKLLGTDVEFWRKAAGTSRLLRARNEVIRDNVLLTLTVLKRLENSVLKWCVFVAHMEDNRWPKQTMTWSLEGR